MTIGGLNPYMGILEAWATKVSREDSWTQGMATSSFSRLEICTAVLVCTSGIQHTVSYLYLQACPAPQPNLANVYHPSKLA